MMKKYFFFATMSAIALAGTLGLTACSSTDEVADDKVVENNPTYDPVAKTVTTQFVLNVAGGEMNATRMSSATVQKNDNFRGITDSKLIALSTGKNTWMAPFAGSSTGYVVNKTFDMGTIYGSSAVTPGTNNETNQASSSNRILELAMPLTTDAMLVYARAIKSGTDEENGKVIMNVTSSPENTTFDLVSRINSRTTEYEQTCMLGATILNRIIDANVTALSKAGDFSHNGYSTIAAVPALTWKELGVAYKNNEPLEGLEEILGKAYVTLTTIKTGELRAGSGNALKVIAQQLYATATSVYNATAVKDKEANAQRLAIEIRSRIGNYFNNPEGSTIEWKSIGNATESNTIIYNLIAAHVQVNSVELTASNYTTYFGSVVTGDLKGLPAAFNLPNGAAILFLDANGKFTYKNPSTSLLDQDVTTHAENYTYPAELLYFDNSALRVNDTEKKAADYPNGVNPWDTEATWTAGGWTWGTTEIPSGGIVTSTTRSIAVKNNINYGVAMLETKVALDGSAFADNRHALIPTESNQSLSADQVKQFKLTGVLIGGQNHQLGWNYLAKANGTTDWDFTIFDNQINGTGAIPTPEGEANYTLVFDNYHPGTQADQTDVLVALEFENQGIDFYGKDNLVLNGGKFYLVGKLELGTKTIADGNWPAYYAIPPYTSAGATNKITRVFVQDFMTTATFKIGATSLQNAFVTVPDLRSTQTSLGLSVDLKWQTGLSFDTVLGN
jgi:hypothetical protein